MYEHVYNSASRHYVPCTEGMATQFFGASRKRKFSRVQKSSSARYELLNEYAVVFARLALNCTHHHDTYSNADARIISMLDESGKNSWLAFVKYGALTMEVVCASFRYASLIVMYCFPIIKPEVESVLEFKIVSAKSTWARMIGHLEQA